MAKIPRYLELARAAGTAGDPIISLNSLFSHAQSIENAAHVVGVVEHESAVREGEEKKKKILKTLLEVDKSPERICEKSEISEISLPRESAGVRKKRMVRGVAVLESDCWATPPEIFEPLDAEFGFGLDVCAEPATAKCARFYTPAENGLEQPWDTERPNWCNPPYSRGEIDRWLSRAWRWAKAGATTVALVPHDSSTVWWGLWVRSLANGQDPTVRVETRGLDTRPKFLNPDTGQPAKSGNKRPCVVVIYRPVVG